MKNTSKKIIALFTMAVMLFASIFTCTIVSPKGLAKAEINNHYDCNAITFGDIFTTNFDTQDVSYRTVDNETTLEHNVDYTISFSKAAHPRYVTGPIHIGGTTTSGKVIINLANLECTRALVYAATWSGESAGHLTVNGQSSDIHTTVDDNYTFSQYVFEFDKTSTLDFTTTVGCGRVLVSKIVLRTY